MELGDLPRIPRRARPRAADSIDVARRSAARAGARLRDGRARRANEDATAADIERDGARIVREAIDAGALGFSTSRSLYHRTLDGEHVPGTFAAADELHRHRACDGRRRRRGVRGGRRRRTDGRRRPSRSSEVELMGRVAEARRAAVVPAHAVDAASPTCGARSSSCVEQAAGDGVRLTPQVAGRPGGMLIGVASHHPFMRRPTYRRHGGLAPVRPVARGAAHAGGEGRDPRRAGPAARPASPVRDAPRQRSAPVATCSCSATRPTTSPLPTAPSRGSPRPRAVTRTTSFYDRPRPTASSCSCAVRQLRRGNEDAPRRDDHAPRHRHRTLRRRRAREDDLRRVGAHLPALALGARPHARSSGCRSSR